MSVYAKIGESLQQIGGNCPDGFIEMIAERPGAEYVATADRTWVISSTTKENEYVDPTLCNVDHRDYGALD